MSETGHRRCAVLGGAGMLGYEIARQLIDRGDEVRVLDLAPLDDPRCRATMGDIRDPSAVDEACRDADVVFQTAAAVWDVRTPPALYEQVNVDGNRVVLQACLRLGVPRLVYTSSMDVVVDGRKPIVDGDEDLPYPARMPKDAYSRSKIIAERMILEANGARLATCSLRPVGMYGPRDKYHLGNIIGMARKGVSVRLGGGSARFSHAYSENVAHAHVLAGDRLEPGSAVAGQFVLHLRSLPRGKPLRLHGTVPPRAGSAGAASVHTVSPGVRSRRRGGDRGSVFELQPVRRCADLRRSHLRGPQGRAGPRLSAHRVPRRSVSKVGGVASSSRVARGCRS